MAERLAGGGVRVHGVVTPIGANGYNEPPDPQWRLTFILEPWRVAGEKEVRRRLRVEYPVGAKEIDKWRERLTPGVPLAFILDRLPRGDQDRVTMVALKGPCDDPGLAEIAEQQRNRPAPDDEQFGQFAFDPVLEEFTVTADWGGTQVELSIWADDAEPDLALARRLWAKQAEVHRRIEERMIAELLPLKNRSWLEEGEAPVTASAFLAAVKPTDVSIVGPDCATFYFDDGDLFWGHSIEATLYPDTGEIEVNLAG